MRCVPVAAGLVGEVVARAVRRADGAVLIAAQTTLTSDHLRACADAGIAEIYLVGSDKNNADLHAQAQAQPEYLDRYGADFAARLHVLFADAQVNRSMQKLFLAALGHAAACYRAYRLDAEDGEE